MTEQQTTDDERVEADHGSSWWSQLDFTRLAHPALLIHVVTVIAGLLVLAWPERSGVVLGRLVGATMVLAGLALLNVLRYRSRPTVVWLGYVAAIALGVYLVIRPAETDGSLGRLLGAAAVVTGIWLAGRALFTATADRSWELARSGVLVTSGVVLILFPQELLGAVITIAAALLVVFGLWAIVLSLDARRPILTQTQARNVISEWIRTHHDRLDAGADLDSKLLFGPPLDMAKFSRFAALMVLAAGISSMGVIADSTAVVIGAMLVAPLMTPLMGMAYSLVMGWPSRLATVTGVAVVGIGLAIGVGLLLGLWEPATIDVATNSQILSRSKPTVIDLITATFAGAAGAYGTSRPSVSDSLPGVAIAIALVPPLTVVGLSYSQGAWVEGNGALLLFLTNMVAILVVGGITFVLTGAVPYDRVAGSQRRLRTWVASIAVLGGVVIAGLLLNGADLARDAWRDRQASDTVGAWLEEFPDHRLVEVEIAGDELAVVISGPSSPVPDPDELARLASEAFGTEFVARARLVVEEQLVSSNASDDDQ